VELPLARLPEAFDGFSIAQLSDFHYDPYLSIIPIRRAVQMVNGLNPDLIALTGDFVTVPMFADFIGNFKHAALDTEPCGEILSQLRARSGRFCVLGNHDFSANRRLVTEILASYELPVLHNRAVAIERSGSRIWIAGLDDCMEGEPHIDESLKGIPPNEFVMMLVHEPDVADELRKRAVDLQLSGHSHGGQIWLPGIGAPWLPELAHKYPRGLRQLDSLTLYTNFGLGTIRIPVRMNCPPEVTFFILRSGAGKPTITSS